MKIGLIVLKYAFIIGMMVALSSIGFTLSYASSNDDNHLSTNDAVYSSPGYLNKEIQQARTLSDKYLSRKDKAEAILDNTQKDVSYKVKEEAAVKPKPELKQKQSSGASSAPKGQVSASKLPPEAANFIDPAKVKQMMDEAKAQGSASIDLTHTQYYKDSTPPKLIKDYRVTYWYEDSNPYFKIEKYDSSGNTSLVVGREKFEAPEGSQYNFISNITNNQGSGFWVIVTSYAYQNDGTIVSYNTTESARMYDASGGLVSRDDHVSYLTNNSLTGNLSYKFDTIANSSNYASDINGSGKVDIADLGVLRSVLGKKTSDLTDAYKRADINRDGIVDNSDVTILSTHFGPTQGVAYSGYTSLINNQVSKNTTYQSNVSFSNNATSYEPLYSTPDGLLGSERSPLLNYQPTNGTIYSVSGIFKSLLANKDNLKPGDTGQISPDQLAKMIRDSLGQNALAVPMGRQASSEELDIAARLANAIKNPTMEQKIIIDSAMALLADIKKAGDQSGQGSLELKKAADDLLQMMASLLLAQAVPDLLKQGDVSNIKGIFADLGKAKDKIMSDYQGSTKSYYENIIKDLAKNMAILQSKNILTMSKEELEKIPPSELDKILEKIKQQKSRAFEEEYILQQEIKYRKAYLEPGKQKLEENMKLMLKDFTGKISSVLQASERK